MPIIDSSYHTSHWFVNGHTDTIIPFLLQRTDGFVYTRERISTDDGDFLDLDWSRRSSQKLVIFSHGMEGSSESPYIHANAKNMNEAGWDVLAWNYRGCSGELNKLISFYHGGCSHDLKAVIDHVLNNYKYDEIALVGFSMGGNVIIKYLGEMGSGLSHKISKAVAFSLSCDVQSFTTNLSSGLNYIYTLYFMRSFKSKILKKAKIFPELIKDVKLSSIRSFDTYSTHFILPYFPFKSVEDYYTSCSAKHYISEIKIPTYIINAKNDPFLSESCFPVKECKESDNVFLEMPEQGGHMGFMNYTAQKSSYTQERILQILQ